MHVPVCAVVCHRTSSQPAVSLCRDRGCWDLSKKPPRMRKRAAPRPASQFKKVQKIFARKKKGTPQSRDRPKKLPPGQKKSSTPPSTAPQKASENTARKNKAHLTAGTVQKSLPPPLPGQEKSSLPPSSATRKARAPKKTHPGKDIPHCRDLPRRSPPGQNKSSTPPSTARHRAPKENLLKKKPHLTAGALPKRPPLPLHSLPPPSPGQEQWRTPPRTTHQIWPRNTLPPPTKKKAHHTVGICPKRHSMSEKEQHAAQHLTQRQRSTKNTSPRMSLSV